MAEKRVTVVIDGKETVSVSSDKAARALDTFGAKTNGWVNGWTDFRSALQLASGAISRIWQVVTDSLTAYDNYERAVRKLGGTSKITGIELEDLESLALGARRAFKLSTPIANEFATEIAKLTSKAGDTTKAKEALAAFLEIGAARGLSAAQTLTAVGQAVVGIDEGTDKLFNKNPSALYAEYAVKIGTTAGKLTEQEKAQAIVNAALEAGVRVGGSYEEFLGTTAGKLDQFNQKSEEASAELGRSMNFMRGHFLDIGGTVLPWLKDAWRRNFDEMTATVFAVKGGALGLTGALAGLIGKTDLAAQYGVRAAEANREYEKFTRLASKSSAELAEENSRVSGSFLDVIPQAQGTKKAFDGMLKPIGDANTLFGAVAKSVGSVGPKANMTAKEIEAYGKMTVTTSEKVSKRQKTDEEETRELLARIKAHYKLLEGSVVTYKEVVETLAPAVRQAMETREIAGFNTALDASKRNADALMAKMKEGGITMPKDVRLTRDAVAEAGVKLGDASGAVIDLGLEFGGLDGEAQVLLTSVEDVGRMIGQMAVKGLSFAGVAGIVGGVAAIVSSMMAGDSERKRLLAANNERLAQVRDGISALNVNLTGKELSNAANALQSFVPTMKPGSSAASAAANFPALVAALASNGLTINDLRRIAKEVGIELEDKNGNFQFGAIPQLLEMLKGVGRGGFGTGFGDQLNSTRQGFNVNRTNDSDQISQLGALGGRFSDALKGVVDGSDLGGSRDRLTGIFSRLQRGELSATEMGGLTGAQFLDFITDIIGRIDRLTDSNARGDSGDPARGGTTTTSGDLVAPPPSGGPGGTVPTETIQAVILSMDTNLGAILTTHTTLQERIADATESSAMSLTSIDGKMDTLISATLSDTTASTNAALATQATLDRIRAGL